MDFFSHSARLLHNLGAQQGNISRKFVRVVRTAKHRAEYLATLAQHSRSNEKTGVKVEEIATTEARECFDTNCNRVCALVTYDRVDGFDKGA